MDTLANQEFLYRETPVNYDGTGTLTSIKGNTVSFNQLVQNGNFADTSNWNKHQASTPTFSVSNNEATILASAKGGGIYNSKISVTNGHKYYISVMLKGTSSFEANLVTNMTSQVYHLVNVTTSYSRFSFIQQANSTSATGIVQITDNRETGFDNFYAKNVMVHDLTLMGIDNLTTTAQVEEWLSSHLGNLDYFGFTLGTLIPFIGTGLKTTGKNLNDGVSQGYWINLGATSYGKTENDSGLVIPTLNASNMTISTAETQTRFRACVGNSTLSLNESTNGFNGVNHDGTNTSITINTSGYKYLIVNATDLTKIQVEFGSTATAYESYTSNTLSLPTSTYFPTGMKSAGSVYDELTKTKAITRVESRAYQSGDESDPTVITDGITTYYPLDTPTETDISLDLTYPVWNGGTEQILPVNGSTPSTAPILCDIDYRGLIPVNATVDPSGSGTVSGTGNYRYHSEATLTATPSDEIYRFLRWEDENGDTVSTNATYTFEVGE